MKKLLVLAVIAGIGFYAYKKYTESQDDADLWSEPSQAPDLR
ncbi:MAG: DLW-39 family protein [Candidatus Nanopelagicales bacterium]|nr:DLW-39 family protein [Candidatus Nanopelagicales bacterium]